MDNKMNYEFVPAVPDCQACFPNFNVYQMTDNCCQLERYWGDTWIIKAHKSFFIRPNELQYIKTGLFMSIPSCCIGSFVTLCELFCSPPHFQVASSVIFPNFAKELVVPLYNITKRTVFVSTGEDIAFFELYHDSEIPLSKKEIDLCIDCKFGSNSQKHVIQEHEILTAVNQKFKKSKERKRIKELRLLGVL